MARNRELIFQSHILDSYQRQGGYGRKWASDVQAGQPDLVLAFQGFGSHLMEVKHRPSWTFGREYKNPLTDKQRKVCGDYVDAGGNVLGGVVIGEDARTSTLCLFVVTMTTVLLFEDISSPYKVSEKYNISFLLNNWSTRYGWK